MQFANQVNELLAWTEYQLNSHCLNSFISMSSDTQVLVCGDRFMDWRVCTAWAHNPPNNHQRGEQFITFRKLTQMLRFLMFTLAWPRWTCQCWCLRPVWRWTCPTHWEGASTWGWSCPEPRWPWMQSTQPAMSWPPALIRTWSLLLLFQCSWLFSPYLLLCSEWSCLGGIAA